ncbi:hypothetical protein [Stenotrophomonas sp. YIM B06876]|uniref:hypothetical protein n=1 Tax=Stenotrophomonas sp. YIM B06876 TaxID=3060211 RepID=UPI002738ABFB|nr:hypothetical protein [Stenotrophomonas sp. YIM B06876]
MSSRTLVRDRQRIAQLAARQMAQSGSRDTRQAVHKAAHELGLRSPAQLPDQAQVTEALHEHLRLFAPASRLDALKARREAARQALQFLQDFSPRLVGAVLDGSADRYSPVQMHLHSDEPEAVQHFLENQRIPAHLGTRQLRLQRGRATALPCWQFDADGIAFELLVLPHSALRQPPLQPLDDTPMPRASLTQLQQRIAAETAPG